MFKKIFNKILSVIMRSRGYSSYFSTKVAKETIADFLHTKDVSFKEKMWAYKRGFFSKNINKFGLNEENYHDYMPDFDYYKLHPINGKYSKWIDDKLTFKYILNPFGDYLPNYYFYLNENKVTKLMDCPEEYDANILNVIKLLEKEKKLAMKLTASSLGVGFYKLSYNENRYLINDEKMTKEKLIQFFEKAKDYTISEYLISHKNIRNIYSGSANNLRVMLVNDEKQNKPKITGAFIKFGTKKSGMIEHIWAGGIFCKVKLDSGCITQATTIRNGRYVEMPFHPDTNVKIEGEIPYWAKIKEKLTEIAEYIPQINYMGFDVVITDNSFKILEINSHQGLDLMQVFYPVMKNNYNKIFFEGLMEKTQQ